LCLNSLGGSFAEGLAIAKNIENGSKTLIPGGAQCYSACAIIFMGGSFWEEGMYYPRRKLSVHGKLGFHAPYMVLPDHNYSSEALASAYKLGLQSVAEMIEIGQGIDHESAIPPAIIYELLKKGPDEAYMVDTVDKANKLHITLVDVPKPTWDQKQVVNACINHNDGNPPAAVDAQGSIGLQTIKLPKGGLEYDIDGVYAEGSLMCVVRVYPGKPPRASMNIGVSRDDFPLKEKDFKPLLDLDAIGVF
jgi:hypothetical protein